MYTTIDTDIKVAIVSSLFWWQSLVSVHLSGKILLVEMGQIDASGADSTGIDKSLSPLADVASATWFCDKCRSFCQSRR